MTIGKFGRTVKTQYSARTAARAHAHAAVHSRKAPIDHVSAALPHDSQAEGRETSHSLGCVVSEPLAQRAGLVVQRPVVLDLHDVIVLRPYLGVGPRLATAASYAGAMHACTAAETETRHCGT